jgi:hypothetical protein
MLCVVATNGDAVLEQDLINAATVYDHGKPSFCGTPLITRRIRPYHFTERERDLSPLSFSQISSRTITGTSLMTFAASAKISQTRRYD